MFLPGLGGLSYLRTGFQTPFLFKASLACIERKLEKRRRQRRNAADRTTKQRSMRIPPVAVAWRRKYLIDPNFVDLFVAVLHPNRLWGSGTDYDTLDITCKFHKWCEYCLEAEDSEGIEARLRRIDRLLDALGLKSEATKRADWKAAFWRKEEEELEGNMWKLYSRPPGFF